METPLIQLGITCRVLELQAQYLRQADELIPTVEHYLAWIRLVHRQSAADELPLGDVDPLLPRLLYALPLFRHYVVSQERGSFRGFIAAHLSDDDLALVKRFYLPAHEHSQILQEFHDQVYNAQRRYYQQCFEGGSSEKGMFSSSRLLGEMSCTLSPDNLLLFMTICNLPHHGLPSKAIVSEKLTDGQRNTLALEQEIFPPFVTVLREKSLAAPDVN